MITTWSAGLADENMAEDILVELAGIVRRHPWWKARTALTLALLEQLDVCPPAWICDAGCGWGSTLAGLERRGYRAVGVDISRAMLERLERERPGRDLIVADLTRPLPPGAGGYDAVLALDVIEHIDEDRAAVERLGQLARNGGVVVVSVPALPDLYTEFDAIQGHRRRYLPETLRDAFAGTGLELESVFWWGSWLVPLLRRQRARPRARPGESVSAAYARYLKLPPWPAPLALRLGFALEHVWALSGRLSTGTSLFAVARRPGATAGLSSQSLATSRS